MLYECKKRPISKKIKDQGRMSEIKQRVVKSHIQMKQNEELTKEKVRLRTIKCCPIGYSTSIKLYYI